MNKFFTSQPQYQDAALAIVRILTGLFMVYHGWEVFNPEKMAPYAEWEPFKNSAGKFLTYLGKSAELVGGLSLALGLFTRLGAIAILITMAYISFFVGHGKVWYEDQHPFMFVLLAIIYLAAGGGPWSIDRKLFG